MVLDRKPSVDARIDVDRASLPGGSGVVVFADGQQYDLVALCERCHGLIWKFLVDKGWELPELRLVPELGEFVR